MWGHLVPQSTTQSNAADYSYCGHKFRLDRGHPEVIGCWVGIEQRMVGKNRAWVGGGKDDPLTLVWILFSQDLLTPSRRHDGSISMTMISERMSDFIWFWGTLWRKENDTSGQLQRKRATDCKMLPNASSNDAPGCNMYRGNAVTFHQDGWEIPI